MADTQGEGQSSPPEEQRNLLTRNLGSQRCILSRDPLQLSPEHGMMLLNRVARGVFLSLASHARSSVVRWQGEETLRFG